MDLTRRRSSSNGNAGNARNSPPLISSNSVSPSSTTVARHIAHSISIPIPTTVTTVSSSNSPISLSSSFPPTPAFTTPNFVPSSSGTSSPPPASSHEVGSWPGTSLDSVFFDSFDSPPSPSGTRTSCMPPVAYAQMGEPLLSSACKKIFNQREFSDVTFLVGEERVPFYGHRALVAAWSSFFSAMFRSGMRESVPPCEVVVQDVEPETFAAVLRFMYTGDAGLTVNTAMPLLAAANFFDVPPLKKMCCDFVRNNLSVENCCAFISAAAAYNCSDLYKECFEFVLEHFEELSYSETWKELDKDTFVRLIADDLLKISSEEIVFDVVVKWYTHQCKLQAGNNSTASGSSDPLLEELLPHVRFPQMSGHFLSRTVKRNDLALSRAPALMKDLLLEAFEALAVPDPQSNSLAFSPRLAARWSKDIIAFYPLDEGSGNVIFDRTNRAATTPSARAAGRGVITGARWFDLGSRHVLEFDGVRDVVTIEDTIKYNSLKRLTISFWANIKGRGHTTFPRFISRGQNDPFSLMIGRDFRLRLYWCVGEGSQVHDIESRASLEQMCGTFHHFAVTWDGRSVTFYIDGEPESTHAAMGDGFHQCHLGGSGGLLGSKHRIDPPVYLGNSRDGRPFHGQLADVMVFNRGLTQHEIKNIYTTQVPMFR